MWRSGWMSYFSCMRIYACATRGTKRPWAASFLHICQETTTVAYLVTAQNCSGFGMSVAVVSTPLLARRRFPWWRVAVLVVVVRLTAGCTIAHLRRSWLSGAHDMT